jgi:hypothetical protein
MIDHPTQQHPANTPLPRSLRWGLGAAAVLATLGVFALYQRPEFLINLADQLWACF